MRAVHTFVVGLVFSAGGSALADTLGTFEIAVTNSSASETTPTLGADAASSIVVYTSRDGSANGQVFYQRLSKSAVIGSAILVSEGGTDDQLNDVSGDYIVYTSYVSASSDLGEVKLYEISSGSTTVLSELTTIFEARVHDRMVAWVEGSLGATRIMLFSLDGLVRGERAIQIAGPMPPASDVEIGSRLVVWTERVGSQLDVAAYDMLTGATLTVAADPSRNERSPSTSGTWVAWQSSATAVPGTRVEAMNVSGGEHRMIADNSASNFAPTIDGDVVAYESNVAGNFDVYLYRLSAGDTFQVTSHDSDQRLNNVYGDQVAYVDARGGSADVYVSTFEFVPERPVDPCAAQGGDSDGDAVCDAADNCPSDANLDQADADGDGAGDACDVNEGPGGETGPELCDAAALPGNVAVLFDGSWQSEERSRGRDDDDDDRDDDDGEHHGNWGHHTKVNERHEIAASGGDVVFCLSVTGSAKGNVHWNGHKVFGKRDFANAASAAVVDSRASNRLKVHFKLRGEGSAQLRILEVSTAVLGVSASLPGESPTAAGCASTPAASPAFLMALAALVLRRRSR